MKTFLDWAGDHPVLFIITVLALSAAISDVLGHPIICGIAGRP